ncbi:MAG TPA: AAA family ATPase [Pirellulales bacterium]|nr:AAA family ATPase [Pirellulales bacterium]
MALHRFPIVVWQDAQGYFTALVVSDAFTDPPAATALAADRARLQLKDYLDWLYAREPWRGATELIDVELRQFAVPVRAEYQFERRVFAGGEPFTLRVPCVTGRERNGPYFAALPLLDLQFYYHEPAALSGLVSEYVQQQLKGSAPSELARFVPPVKMELEEIVVRVKDRPSRHTASPELPTLDLVAEPLDDRAARRRFARAWLRESEAAGLARQLKTSRANLLLVGPTGVGKTTLLTEAIRQLDRLPNASQPDANAGPADLERLHFWLTSAGRLIAGMQYLGQWEERCQNVIAELRQASGVLCIENLLDLALAGGHDAGDGIAMFFLPYLERGELRLVGEATASELTALRRHLPGLVDLFQIVPVAALGRPAALEVLERQAVARRQQWGVTTADGVPALTYDLFRRFAPYDTFPGETVRFFDDLLDRGKRQGDVTEAATIDAFVRRTGLPERLLRDDRPILFDDVLADFRREVVGQDAACQAAARLVVTFKAGLNDPQRPLGVLLFCGPTGVGKTQLAKAMSRYFFGHGEKHDRLVRLDMSEYGGFDAVERLLGKPGGAPSELVKRVRRQPFVVVLLDEIEKAAGEVFDVLLGMFDEGRLTDAYGRTTNFRSAVIIMTSNLGAEAPPPAGFDWTAQPHYEGAVASFFRPEFYNRIDAVVRFTPLAHEHVLAITRKELAEIAMREGLSKRGLTIEPGDRLVEHVAALGSDARYGARPLQRVLERHVVSPLSRWLLLHGDVSHCRLCLDLDAENQLQLAVHRPS